MDKDQMDFNKEIGMRIRRHREFLDFTREELAEKADISTQFLADIETGRKSMTPHDKKYATEILKLYMKALQPDQ